MTGAHVFDPSCTLYRSEEYAMCLIDTGRDSDGAPIDEVWTFAGEDDGVEGYGWLEVRIHEIVETERSGALAVYYRQWFAPDGRPAWGKAPHRKVGALSSLKSLIRRRKMRPCDSDGVRSTETACPAPAPNSAAKRGGEANRQGDRP